MCTIGHNHTLLRLQTDRTIGILNNVEFLAERAIASNTDTDPRLLESVKPRGKM